MDSEKLLEMLEESVVTPGSSVEDSLRIALILASQLDAQDLVSWCEYELEGYDEGAEVPDYRKLHQTLIGSSSGPFGRMIQGHEVFIELVLNEEIKQALYKMRVREIRNSLAEVRSWCERDEIVLQTPPDYLTFLKSQFDGFVLFKVNYVINKAQITGLLDSVKTQLVRLVSEFRGLQKSQSLDEVGADKINQRFESVVYNVQGDMHLSKDVISVQASEGSSVVGKQNAMQDAIIHQGVDLASKTVSQQEWEQELVEILHAVVDEMDSLGENFNVFVETSKRLKQLNVDGKKIEEIYEMVGDLWVDDAIVDFDTWYQQLLKSPTLMSALGLGLKQLVALADQ